MIYKIFALLTCFTLAACGGQNSFNEQARAGDTVAVPVGMQPTFNKDNITVTITPSIGAPIILLADDSAIRAIINFYADPVSNMIVSREIGENTSPSSINYADSTLIFSNKDKDYFQTTVFIDLPLTLPVGIAEISISNSLEETHTITLDIIVGIGAPHSFLAHIPGTESSSFTVDKTILNTLARSTHTVVSFNTANIPHAIEVNFTHDPDKTIGGSGKAFVVNPLGYIKNLSWQDDGINLKVILVESQQGIIDNIKDFKFYVAGTTTNLQLQSVYSYDIDGNILSGTNAVLTIN